MISELTPNKVICWAIDNNCDFVIPSPQPPKGWIWSPLTNDRNDGLMLMGIMGNIGEKNITPTDMIKAYISIRNAFKKCE